MALLKISTKAQIATDRGRLCVGGRGKRNSGESACRTGSSCRGMRHFLCDNNNNSWSEVWENHLKVSRGTDGPAALLWRVTMVMWI